LCGRTERKREEGDITWSVETWLSLSAEREKVKKKKHGKEKRPPEGITESRANKKGGHWGHAEQLTPDSKKSTCLTRNYP